MLPEKFQPAVRRWFQTTFAAPTECQSRAWDAIQAGQHTLIAAPTGSGKTLAAFLSAIDDLVRQAEIGWLADQIQVLYISPLRALSNDIQRNLSLPLEGIARELSADGRGDIGIRSAVRTGDTPPSLRAGMRRRPPHILVTTPESLYILLTSQSGREMLRSVRSVIVDEIHALAGNKRGAHLSLSLERLCALTAEVPVRVGLSATQSPIERMADFLLGQGQRDAGCRIIDLGHVRQRDLGIVVPDSPLEAVMSGDTREEVYDKLQALIAQHRTTLVFVNTRRMAERVARHLSERIGEARVTSHHGSLSRERRLDAEQRLKAGQLSCLVATASLELGIDIGEVDLVCQLGSTRIIGSFLQRVGRSGHGLDRTPKGRLFPLSRDDLIECIALMEAAQRGDLDRLTVPDGPLDVLAQQLVAEVAGAETSEQALFQMVRRAYPYRALTREQFEAVLRMLSEGYAARRSRASAFLFRDAVNGRLRPRRSARLTAMTNGGAIPDTAVYDVRMEPADTFVGTVDEDFAIETLRGDIFQLGNTSWRVLRVETGVVRVEDAHGQPPNIPFWVGEAPGRTASLSAAVSRVREGIEQRLANAGPRSAEAWLNAELGICPDAAQQAVEYLAAARAALGALPTQSTLILERFFDEAGGMQLVLHAPLGNRLNRAWGLALRKCFCRKFNFELQAAASDDAVVLSLGETHSFPLEEVWDYLKPATLRDLLAQAVLASPLFGARWRWNATCALAVARFRAGRKVPPQLVRMQAEDLVSVVFPDQIACQDNLSGPREIPDHPLVNQTMKDCLEEALDTPGLERMLRAMAAEQLTLLARDVTEPSPLAHEILNARPYAFLDDAPLEERRTRAVATRRWTDPKTASDLGRLDAEAIERVRAEAWPRAQDADELHDALLTLGFMTEAEAGAWMHLLPGLTAAGRAVPGHQPGGPSLWMAAERVPELRACLPALVLPPDVRVPAGFAERRWGSEEALVELLRSRLTGVGPVTAAFLAATCGLAEARVQAALLALEAEGFAMRGQFTGADGLEWCERRLLARIHRYTLKRLRREIEPVSSQEFLRFLIHWQGLGSADPGDIDQVMARLEGYVAPAIAWESELLARRLPAYAPGQLDGLTLSGRYLWCRIRPRAGEEATQRPLPQTPIGFIDRRRAGAWLNAHCGAPVPDGPARRVAALLEQHGALFFQDILAGTGLQPAEVLEALSILVAAGRITADGFAGLRGLLSKGRLSSPGRRREVLRMMEEGGRWSLLDAGAAFPESGETAQQLARALLRRYGIVFRGLLEREVLAPPWRQLLSVLRRLEARGDIRGGRFVNAVYGEQFALPAAVERLRRVRREPRCGQLVVVSGADPVNLQGIVTPGERLPALAGNRLLLLDGQPVATYAGGALGLLVAASEDQQASWRAAVGGHAAAGGLRRAG